MTTIIDGTSGVTFPAGGVGNPAGAVVGTTDTQTLTNKTLTAPTLASANITTALTLTGASGTSGQVLTSAGSGSAPTWSSVSASPGGSTTQLQYNNSGSFAGISGATTDGTRITHSTTVGVGGATPSTSGSGITFPATQSASTNANTLDDYERGTWTPTIIAATGNVTSQTCSGSYVKIGKLVYVTFSIKPDTGTISEIDHIDGLPYATDSISPAGFGSARSNATGNMWFTRTISSDSSIYLAQYNNTSSLSAGQTIIGAIAYIAAT